MAQVLVVAPLIGRDLQRLPAIADDEHAIDKRRGLAARSKGAATSDTSVVFAFPLHIRSAER